MAQRAGTLKRIPQSAPTSASDSEPDVYIGEFVRGKEIGKGSFASVYLASHRKKRSYAAVKAVLQGKLTRKLKENLESEIRILKSLQHPHIVALFTCTETPSFIYLVMEYCQLSDLAQFMKKRNSLSQFPETADIFTKYPNSPNGGLNEVVVRHFIKQIASAMEYLRSRNLIHRDIKPQNLLLNPSPAYMQRQKPEDVPLAASEHSLVPAVGIDSLPMLKIADFGFARHLPQQMMAETLCGSPLYMAPEILSYQKYDAKADLWSVGTVTYEMLVGKPPFRAANHIELLRRIDKAEDLIPFPTGVTISSDLKRMIRSLLKRQPTERVSFEGFFQSGPVTGPIPGLQGEDIPSTANAPLPDPGMSELSRRMQKQAIDNPSQTRQSSAIPPPATHIGVSSSFPTREATPESSSPLNPDRARRPSGDGGARRTSTGDTGRHIDIDQPSVRTDARRPGLVAHATAPAREHLFGGRASPSIPAAAMERRSSRNGPSPSTSAPKQPLNIDQTRRLSNERALREARERTAQDLAFEREYVMIEKRAVEVNAFADELAASPHLFSGSRNQPASAPHSAMVRRQTTQGLPGSTTGAQPPSPSSALQMAAGRRPSDLHARQASFDRRYAPNPASATNMLSKALNMANARLFGAAGASPPLGAGPSPPRGYGAFPVYPAPSPSLAITDGKETSGALDEDSKILRIVEEAATRSDTVYSFAEVKYRQLLPATPSADQGSGIRRIGAHEKPLQASDEEVEDQDLTQLAVVAVSEEALVLFVKALTILAKSIDLAGYWWNHQRGSSRGARSGELTPEPSPSSRGSSGADVRSNTAEVGKRMNNVVQWARNRFNECLEKSEIVGRRLLEAQRQLPLDHPAHPSNANPGTGSRGSDGQGSSSGGSGGVPVTGSIAMSAEQIQLTSGVTAEKLMFERACEMSRAAAVNELVGEDLKGCEIGYRTAIVLFEAVLEGDDEPLLPRPSADKSKGLDEIVNGMEREDRRKVIDLSEAARTRLRALVRKIQDQAVAERRAGAAPSAQQSGPQVPKPSQIRSTPSPTTILGTPPR